MRLFLSYCKSHIYELHALLAATITFFLMFEIKKPIKIWTHKYVTEKARKNQKWSKNKKLYNKRCNMLVVITTIIIAAIVFVFFYLVSPFISFSLHMTWLSGAFALAEYAVYDQTIGKERKDYE